MTVVEAFAKNVKEALIENEWSQSKLARISGVSKPTISSLLRCSYGPTLYTVYAVAKALDVSIDELIEGADE